MYVGYTGKSINKRFNSHSFDVRHRIDNTHLHNAMRKYGCDAFCIEAIYQSTDKIHTHKVMEPYFINEYNTFKGIGYNLTSVVEGFTGNHSEETKQLISEKTIDTHKGQIPWNKGLTKDLDSRVNNMYENRKQNKTWRKNFIKTPEKEARRLKAISKRVSILGIEYSSAREAFRKLDTLKYITLIKRIKSKNFPEYSWVT